MLQAMRNKMHGWPSIIVLGLAVLAMSLFGMESYFTSQNDTFVAKVGKREISQNAFQNRMNQLRQQFSAQQGDQFDPATFEKQETKLRILDAMIDEQLLLQANADWGMRVSDQSLRDAIAGIPAFQVSGKFDPTSYRAYLANSGKTSAMSTIRSSLATQLLPQAIDDSAIISDQHVDDYLGLATQRRDLRYFLLAKPDPAEKQVTDAQIESWYKAHQADYMNPEQVSVKYVEVDGAKLTPKAAPSEEELKARYRGGEAAHSCSRNNGWFRTSWINVPANATPDQQKAALTTADKVAAEATPANLPHWPKRIRRIGSRRQGGDLGGLGRDQRRVQFGDVRAAEGADFQAGAVVGRLPHHLVARRAQRRLQAVRRGARPAAAGGDQRRARPPVQRTGRQDG
ncbi:Periplasmic chaperone PpiD OS=Rhodanobacter lindaniclasticus OX=75310 GN=B1991_12410 PE=3 SV=1 [Rhodanobacter lindaniclasticus]